jgi:cell division protein FtsI (penicillin-binding protein 3)
MKEYKNRLLHLLVTFLFLFLLLFIRVIYLTFFNSNLSESKTEQRIQRGVIYDRRGLELALSQDSSTIGINPSKVYDSNFTANKLSPIVGIPVEKIESLILEKSNYFLLKREMENIQASKIAEMSLPGVRIEKEYKRIYPNGSLASNLIGFTGVDDNQSLSGIELNFHKELQSYADNDTLRGNDIYLTIDSLIQSRLESALGEAFTKTKSKKAVGILMDVHTGRIIAMANFPNFDPNRYYDYSGEKTTNWALRLEYEPGSTMKVFMGLILLNENMIDLNEKFYCPGFVEFGSRRVNCGDKHDMLDLDEILQYSCNVGIIKAIKKVPDKTIYKYMKQFGFGLKTGLLQDELKGRLPALKDWTPSTAYYMAIGQGFSVTPIQLVTAAASLVNGGKMIKPSILSHITNSYGEIIKQYDVQYENIGLREDVTGHLIRALTKVVKQGTGQKANTQAIGIIGKTGTSQISIKGKGYQEGLFNASFLGFFPADKPQIVGLILLSEPESQLHSGGGIAAPVFKEVVENIIPIVEFTETPQNFKLGEFKSDPIKTDINRVPNFKGKTIRESLQILKNYKVKFKTYGSGFNYKQSPEPNESAKENDTWHLYFKQE